ncbi:TIGR02569 family protein [Corynebacterium sp. 335C]
MTLHPPSHVLDGFGAIGAPEPAGPAWDDGLRYGDMVLSRVADGPVAAWSAKVRSALSADRVAAVRSHRTSDGRHVLAGWQARQWAPGAPARRFDEAVVAAIALEEALAGLQRPRFLSAARGDVFSACDRAAWAHDPASELERVLDAESVPGEDAAAALAAATALMEERRPVDAPDRPAHGDPLATMLFDGAAVPVVTDIVPRWRPAGWTPALVVADALAWGGADEGLPARFARLPHWDQLLIRAVMYRLFVHAAHPDANPTAWAGLSRAAEIVRGFVRR